MTTLTVPSDWSWESSEQAASGIAVAALSRTATVRFISGVLGSSEEIRHVDGDRAGGTARRARAAVPALVDVHEGLAVVRVDGQRVQGTDFDAECAAFDAQRF